MKSKWKDIYNDNQNRRFAEITGIKKEGIELISNSTRMIKEHKYSSIITILISILILLYTFRNDLKVFWLVLAFFAITGLCFFFFNYFKIKTMEQGLYLKFGFQQGIFSYEKIKSVYLSKYNDNSFLAITNSYNIVIRYLDSYNRIKELSFPTIFLNKEETIAFLENFNIQEIEKEKYVNYEKLKMIKRIGKLFLFVLFFIILFAIGFGSM